MSVLFNYGFSPIHALLISSIFFAAILVELGYSIFAPSDSGKKRINRRMKSANSKKGVSQKGILLQLRKERGLDEDGKFLLPIKWLSRMIVQSGITIGLGRLAACYALYLVFSSLIILYLTGTPLFALSPFPLLQLRSRSCG